MMTMPSTCTSRLLWKVVPAVEKVPIETILGEPTAVQLDVPPTKVKAFADWAPYEASIMATMSADARRRYIWESTSATST
jgi:hypothetical protein